MIKIYHHDHHHLWQGVSWSQGKADIALPSRYFTVRSIDPHDMFCENAKMKPINNEKWFLKSYNIYNIHTSEFHIALYNLLSKSIYVGKKSRSLSKFTSTSPPAQFLTMSHPRLPLEANLGQFHPLIRDFSLAELSSSFSGVRSRESTVLHKGNYDFLQISEQLMGHETLVRLIRNKYSIQYSIEISL